MSELPGTIAVTGASGFVGRRLCSELAERGVGVRKLGRPDFDLLDPGPICPTLFAGCDLVVHLAAYIPPNQNDPATAETCWQTNAGGTLRLVQAMREAGVHRLIQTTSANAYDPQAARPTEADAIFPSQRAPFYLSSKMAQEVFAHHFADAHGFKVTTLRLTSVFGQGQLTGPIPNFARTLLGKSAIQLADGGRFGADFVTVDDVVQAILLCVQHETNGIFNVGSGRRSTMAEVATTIAALCDADPELIQVLASSGGPAPGFSGPDIGKIRALGFEPTDLRAGLAQMIAWMREELANTASSGDEKPC